MKYNVIRTDTADAGIRKIILYIAQNFGIRRQSVYRNGTGVSCS